MRETNRQTSELKMAHDNAEDAFTPEKNTISSSSACCEVCHGKQELCDSSFCARGCSCPGTALPSVPGTAESLELTFATSLSSHAPLQLVSVWQDSETEKSSSVPQEEE